MVHKLSCIIWSWIVFVPHDFLCHMVLKQSSIIVSCRDLELYGPDNFSCPIVLKGSCQSVVWSCRILALLCSRFLVTVLYGAEGFLCCTVVKASSGAWPSRGLVSYPHWQGFWHCAVFHLQEWLCHMFLNTSCVVVFLKSACVILSSKVIVSCLAQGSWRVLLLSCVKCSLRVLA